MVLCADDKRTLTAWAEAMQDYARTRLGLRLHTHSAQAQPTAAGVPWLGFVVYPDHRRLKSRKVVATTRALTRAWQAWQCGETDFDAFAAEQGGHHGASPSRHGLEWRASGLVARAADGGPGGASPPGPRPGPRDSGAAHLFRRVASRVMRSKTV